MKRKTAGRSKQGDIALTKRYGRIGIPAVAAAARYQGQGRNGKSPALRSGGKSVDTGKTKRGTSRSR